MAHLHSRMDYANGLFRTAEYEEAKILFTHLLKIYTKQSHIENMCLCLHRLACIAFIQGEMKKFDEIFSYYKTLLPKVAHQKSAAEYSLLKGLKELSVQHYAQAIQTFSHVVSISDELNLLKLKVSALLFIQKCHLSLDYFDLSLEMSDELWLTFKETITSDVGQLVDYMLNRADTLYKLECFEEMNLLVTKCEGHPDLHMMPKQYVKTLLARAKYYMVKADPHTAMSSLEKAIKLTEALEDSNLLCELYEILIDYYELQGNTKQALYYAKKQLKLQKELVKK